MEVLLNQSTLQIIKMFDDLPEELQIRFREHILSQEFNIMMMTDSYKATHSKMYPKGTTEIYSYLESRGGSIPYTLFFGLQYYLKKYLSGVQVTRAKIEQAQTFWDNHLGPDKFDRDGWEYILNECGGKLPIEIKAVPEGTVVPVKNVLMTIKNTAPQAFFVTNFVETLLMKIWATITVASNSKRLKDLLVKYAEETSDDISHVNFQMHDFGYRGVSSEETAALLGAAHLVSFMGTDTAAAVNMLNKYYDEEMAGFGVPASEHSVMCSHRVDSNDTGEINAFKQILDEYPEGIVSIVSDTYNIYHATNYIVGDILREDILKRNGKVVVRPDSGDPVKILCGDSTAETGSLEQEGIIRILARRFGVTLNSKGYYILNPKIGVIQGDGIDYEMTKKILKRLTEIGFASSNLVFGSGGGLLQKHNRDTMKFAIKASHAIVNGEHKDLQKTPITDTGKRSKKGYLKLVNTNNKWETVEMSADNINYSDDKLKTVFINGDIKVNTTLKEIREFAT